jgi:hypothetical protein
MTVVEELVLVESIGRRKEGAEILDLKGITFGS